MGRESWLRTSSAAAAPRGQQPQREPQAQGSNPYASLAGVSDDSDDSVTSGPGHASSRRTPRPSGTTSGDTTAGAAARGAPFSAPAHARMGDSTQPSSVRFSLIPSQLVGPGGIAAAPQPLLPPPPPPAPRGGGAGAQRTLLETVAPGAGTHRASGSTRTESRATSGDLARSERGRSHSSGATPKRDRSTSRSASRPERPSAEVMKKASGPPSRVAAAPPVPGSDSRRPGIPGPSPATRSALGGKQGGHFDSDGDGNHSRRGEFADFVAEKMAPSSRKNSANGGASKPRPPPLAASSDATSAPLASRGGGGRLRANSRWADSSRLVHRGIQFPVFENVGPAFAPKVDEGSHDISLFARVPPGVVNPLAKDTSTPWSRPMERLYLHKFNASFMNTYNSVAPTYSALAAAACAPFDADGGADAFLSFSCLPPPQDVILHQLSNESVLAATLRFRSSREAARVHAALRTSMPDGLSFANPNASTPHHHSLSRKPVPKTSGGSYCFTFIDVIDMLPKGVSPACDALADKLVGLSPFGGAFVTTLGSATIEITVSPVDLIEQHLIPALGAEMVDSSKGSIFVNLGDAIVELVVLDSDSKHVCVRCNSNCHRVRNCGRREQDMLRKAKEKAERDLRNAALAERERTSKIAALFEESKTLINEALVATRVLSKPMLSVMRTKIERLIEHTDGSAVTSGLVEASGLTHEVAEFYGNSLAAIASQRAFLRGVAVSPASALSASNPSASAAPPPREAAASDESAASSSDVSSVPRAMEVVDETLASDALASGGFTAASSADATAYKRPLDIATSFEESPAKRRSRDDAPVLATSASVLAPSPLSLRDRGALLNEHGPGGIFSFLNGATRVAFPPEPQPFPRVFNFDLVGVAASTVHLGNAIYCDLAQLTAELAARGSSVEQLITNLPTVELECVPYAAASNYRIDAPSNAQPTGVTIHNFNQSAGIFANEHGHLYDNTAYFRIDTELSQGGAVSDVVTFKISRNNPAMAKIAAFFVLAAPRYSLWKASRVVRVEKPPRGADVPLSPDHPALAASGHASLAPVPPYGSTALLPHGAGGGVGQDGK